MYLTCGCGEMVLNCNSGTYQMLYEDKHNIPFTIEYFVCYKMVPLKVYLFTKKLLHDRIMTNKVLVI